MSVLIDSTKKQLKQILTNARDINIKLEKENEHFVLKFM